MKFTALAKYEFYPKIQNNLDLPESERLSVEIIRPTPEERGDLLFSRTTQEIQAVGKPGEGIVKSVSIETKFNVGLILRRHVGAIKNMETDQKGADGKIVKITTGAELAVSQAFGVNRLVDLIVAEVTSDVLTAQEKKSS